MRKYFGWGLGNEVKAVDFGECSFGSDFRRGGVGVVEILDWTWNNVEGEVFFVVVETLVALI